MNPGERRTAYPHKLVPMPEAILNTPGNSPETTDIDLVRAVAGGDRNAVGILYDRHSGVLIAMALRLIPDRGEAEDLVHDVFVEMWRNAHTYDPTRSAVRSWLILRLRSRGLDRLRSARHTRTESIGTEGRPELPDTARSDLGDQTDQQRLSPRLAALPTEQRQVVELAYFSGLSSSEMATTLGLPIGTVKSRMAAAFRKLRADFRVEDSP